MFLSNPFLHPKLALLVGLRVLFFMSQTAQSQTLYGSYKIQSLATAKWLTGNEARMYMADPDGTTYQYWSLQHTDVQVQGHAVYAIRNGNTGLCLTGTPGKIYLAGCDGSMGQIWKVVPADVEGTYLMTNLVTNLLLDSNPGQVFPMSQNGSNYQKWRLNNTGGQAPGVQSRIGTAVSTAPPAYNQAPPAYPQARPAASVGVAPPANPESDPRRVHRYIRRNMAYMPGSSVESKNGKYQVYFQEDGNLVVYRLTDRPKKALWGSNTVISDIGKFSFQDDGNLVIYNRAGQSVWATGTDGRGEYMLLQNDGNLVIYNQAGVAIWATNTAE